MALREGGKVSKKELFIGRGAEHAKGVDVMGFHFCFFFTHASFVCPFDCPSPKAHILF